MKKSVINSPTENRIDVTALGQERKENHIRKATKLVFVVFTAMLFLANANSMEDIPLAVKIRCTDNPTCIYSGTEIPIDIIVRNIGNYPIGFPQAYMQARGPAMKLIDNFTGTQKTLKIGLANHDLMTQFTTLEPNESLIMTSVIRASELTSFRKEYVDLIAEIGITINVRVPHTDEPEKYQGRGRVKIIGKDTIERDQHLHFKR